MICSSCGKEIKDGAKFCTHCGAKAARFCAECGIQLADGDKFCTHCGAQAMGAVTGAVAVTPVSAAKPIAYREPEYVEAEEEKPRVADAARNAANSDVAQAVKRVVSDALKGMSVDAPSSAGEFKYAVPAAERDAVAQAVRAIKGIESAAATAQKAAGAAKGAQDAVTGAGRSAGKGAGKASKPRSEKSAGKKFPIKLVGFVVVVALIGIFAVPGLLDNPDEPTSTGIEAPSTNGGASQGSSAGGNGDSGNAGTSSDAGDSGSNGTGSGASSASSVQQTEMKTGKDGFKWFKPSKPMSSKPTDAKDIKSFSKAMGEWNCLFVYDDIPGLIEDSKSYSTLSFEGAEGNFAVCIDWDYGVEGKEKFSMKKSEDTWLNGEWSNGKLIATGDATVKIKSFFQVGDKQYAVGTMTAATGLTGSVAMYRDAK